jgi:hypothetical protein
MPCKLLWAFSAWLLLGHLSSPRRKPGLKERVLCIKKRRKKGNEGANGSPEKHYRNFFFRNKNFGEDEERELDLPVVHTQNRSGRPGLGNRVTG